MTTRTDPETPDARHAPGELGLSWANRYGLEPWELRREIARCIDAGWRGWEIRVRFFEGRRR